MAQAGRPAIARGRTGQVLGATAHLALGVALLEELVAVGVLDGVVGRRGGEALAASLSILNVVGTGHGLEVAGLVSQGSRARVELVRAGRGGPEHSCKTETDEGMRVSELGCKGCIGGQYSNSSSSNSSSSSQRRTAQVDGKGRVERVDVGVGASLVAAAVEAVVVALELRDDLVPVGLHGRVARRGRGAEPRDVRAIAPAAARQVNHHEPHGDIRAKRGRGERERERERTWQRPCSCRLAWHRTERWAGRS